MKWRHRIWIREVIYYSGFDNLDWWCTDLGISRSILFRILFWIYLESNPRERDGGIWEWTYFYNSADLSDYLGVDHRFLGQIFGIFWDEKATSEYINYYIRITSLKLVSNDLNLYFPRRRE